MTKFDDLKFKFILGTAEVGADIIDKVILCAKCIFHKELINGFKSVKGGGEWKIDHNKKEIIFYGESNDFGRVSIEDIKAVIERNKIYNMRLYAGRIFDTKEYKFFFSESWFLSDAEQNKIPIN